MEIEGMAFWRPVQLGGRVGESVSTTEGGDPEHGGDKPPN